MLSLVNRERQAWSADTIGKGVIRDVETHSWPSVYNWVKGMIRSLASVLVSATGFLLVGKDNISGPQAGLILSFAVTASQGEQFQPSFSRSRAHGIPELFYLLETYRYADLVQGSNSSL